jgi:hypothetical protein
MEGPVGSGPVKSGGGGVAAVVGRGPGGRQVVGGVVRRGGPDEADGVVVHVNTANGAFGLDHDGGRTVAVDGTGDGTGAGVGSAGADEDGGAGGRCVVSRARAGDRSDGMAVVNGALCESRDVEPRKKVRVWTERWWRMETAPIIKPLISVDTPHNEGRICLEELSGEWLPLAL